MEDMFTVKEAESLEAGCQRVAVAPSMAAIGNWPGA
jgi:hypothetical protein